MMDTLVDPMLPFRRRLLCICTATLVLSGCTGQSAHRSASEERAERPATGSNRLASEKSPYLQRHAHNAVDWYPWGPEAFEKARRENKPIFLSIGYSTCHWCHVMEAESFSNAAIADVMNRHFVSIKVDREERPDVDRVYQAYVTSVSNGGWPISVVLTPDLKPFFGATYLPPDTRDGQEGLRPILERLSAAWQTERHVILKAAADGASTVNGLAQIPRPASSTSGVRDLDDTYASFTRSFDRVNGGFGGAPKFARPVVLTFLLRHHARTGAPSALDMTVATLRAMAGGGIHDHLDGGFHRYTVDAAWRVPHFEKMLYDQALLTAAYTDAYQASRDSELARVARSTIDYVLRALRDANGVFGSAEDADSRISLTDARLAEGAFYLWTERDVHEALGRDAALVGYYFDVTADGNLGGAGGERPGANALVVRHTVGETAAKFAMTEPAVQRVLDRATRRLREVRGARPRPARDDTIITAWNGLMISALARAHVVFDDPTYIDAALVAARFLETHLFDPSSSSLKRSYRQGAGDVHGLLDDYAFFIQALLDLFEASFDPRWLSLALRLQATQDRVFWDEKDGAYFSTPAGAADLLARMKEDYDGAEPAANSVAVMNLVRLWHLTGAEAWRTRVDRAFRAMSGRIARSGTAVPQLMAALDFRQAKAKQIVIAGDPAAADTRALLRIVHDRFIPNKVLALVDGGPRQTELAKLVPPLADMTPRDGRATIYVCENYTCHLPTSDPSVAARLLAAEPTQGVR